MLLSSITLSKILSFKESTLELVPVNILIGANGAGKSNLIEAIGLLKAAPVDLKKAILEAGRIRELLWKGDKEVSPIARLECAARPPGFNSCLYSLEFSEDASGFVILGERLAKLPSKPKEKSVIFFERTGGQIRFGGRFPDLGPGRIPTDDPVLARFKNPADPTPITSLGHEFEQIGIYRQFDTGPRAASRWGMQTQSRQQRLDERGDNLAQVLSGMQFTGSIERVQYYLNRFCDRFQKVLVNLNGPVPQTYVQEEGLREPTPAVRLSDGTLKFLCLLAILLNPDSPSLVCIEEPELGLHPDAVRLIGEVIAEVPDQVQVVVTTHSDALVDEFSDKPEAVAVCEFDVGSGTRFERLSAKRLRGWLDRYSLGEAWRRGAIGGTRW